MKEYYTVKELLFATMPEYENIDQKLKRLRELTDSDDKQVEDFFFRLHVPYKTSSNDLANVLCIFTQNPDTLKGFLINFAKKINIYFAKKMSVNCSSVVGDGDILTVNNYEAFIKEGCSEEFSKIVREILGTDYAKYMRMFRRFYREKSTDTNVSLEFMGDEIRVRNYYYANQNVASCIGLFYAGRTGALVAQKYGSIVRDEEILKTLNLLVPAELMSDYHRNLIENSGVQDKPLQIISETEDASKLLIKVEENEDKIVLRKTRSI